MEPLTREEVFLARMSGEDIETPVPQTRKEEYMGKIAEKINEGGGSGGSIEHIGTIKAITTGSITAATVVNNSYIKNGIAYIDIIYEATAGGASAPFAVIEGMPTPKAEYNTVNFPATFYGGSAYDPGAARVIDNNLHILFGGIAPNITHYIHTSYPVKED